MFQPIKQSFPTNSPFHNLSISHDEIKQMINDNKKLQKALVMSSDPSKLRLVQRSVHCYAICNINLWYSENLTSILNIISSLFSDNFSLENNVLSIIVKAQFNKNPCVGRTQYPVEIVFEPNLGGKGVAKSRSRGPKNVFGKYVFTCDCPNFDDRYGICKHIGAVLLKHFKH